LILAGSFLSFTLTKLLLKPVDPASQFIKFLLTGETEVLEQIVAIPFQIASHLLLEFWRFTAQSLQNVIHKCGGMTCIEPSTAHPFLGHVTETVGHQGGGAETTEQQLLEGIGGLHRESHFSLISG